MIEAVLVAAIAALPPTIIAVATLIHARRGAKSSERVDRAVNQQAPGEATLLNRVKAIQDDVVQVKTAQDNTAASFYELHLLVTEHLTAHAAIDRWVEHELESKQDRAEGE